MQTAIDAGRMKTLRSSGLVLPVVCLCALIGAGPAPGEESGARDPRQAAYYPPPESAGGWRSVVRANETPTAAEKQAILQRAGLDWERLQEAWRYCEGFGGPNSLLVIRHGWIAAEWHNLTAPRGIASCTKSLTALAMAKLFDLSDAGKLPKRIGTDDEAWRFLPPKWAEAEPARRRIQVRHLLTMTSGLTPYDGPYGDDYEEKLFTQTVEAPPGSVWAYASVPVDLLSLIIEDVTGQKEEEFFNEQLGKAIGVAPLKWGQFKGHTGGSGGPEGGARFPVRELARVGYLVLHDGVWEKDRRAEHVLGASRIREFTRWAPFLEKAERRSPNFAGEPDGNLYYGHLWWNNRTGQALGGAAPRDIVYMSGWGKQACFVAPSLDMVVVRLGPQRTLNEHPEYYHELWSRLMAAVSDPQARAAPAPAKSPSGTSPAAVERWDTWELTLESGRDYANPFRDTELTATFTHAGSERQISVDGFHDGGRAWRVRFMPTEIGAWSYLTRSSDPGLDARRGLIECVEQRRKHLHGPLRVEGFHFKHADGLRRFLISTRLSCQFAPPDVRQRAIRFLKEHGVNRVLFIMGGVHGTMRSLYGTGPDFDRYDVLRFQAIDAFIEELRREEVQASPYFYYFNDRLQCGMTMEQDQAFLRYGMARFGAYANVMPVLANEVEQKHTRRRDERYDLRSHHWANELGPFLKRHAVFGQPVTVHNPMETDLAVRPGFYTLLRDWSFPWADYLLRQMQVGALGTPADIGDHVPESKAPTYNERALARHNQFLIELRRFKAPVINEEPGYEMGGLSWNGEKRDPRPWNSQTPDTLRSTLWTAAAAGAYTMWGSAATYDMGDPLPELAASPTPRSLKVLEEVMAGLPYWEMEPANGRVAANPVVIDGLPYRTNFALDKPGAFCLVYASRGGKIQVSLEKGEYTVAVVDPRTGERRDLGSIAGAEYVTELPPLRDTVLVIKSRSSRP